MKSPIRTLLILALVLMSAATRLAHAATESVGDQATDRVKIVIAMAASADYQLITNSISSELHIEESKRVRVALESAFDKCADPTQCWWAQSLISNYLANTEATFSLSPVMREQIQEGLSTVDARMFGHVFGHGVERGATAKGGPEFQP